MLVIPFASELSALQALVAGVAVALTSVIISFATLIRGRMRTAKLLASVPGPEGKFLVGFIPELAKNIDRIYDFQVELIYKYGGRMNLPWTLFKNNTLYLTDPADIEHVLSTNMNNWIKSDHFIASMGEVFGKSLLGTNHAHTADGGALYRIERKLAMKVFTTSNFKVFTEGIFHKYAVRTADLITAQHGKIDMHVISSQYTLQTIFDIACGVPLESIDKDLGLRFIKSMDTVFGHLPSRTVFKPYFKYFWWCMPDEYRFKRESKVMLDLVDGILNQRLRESEAALAKRSDILSMFIRRARELKAEGAAILDVPTLRSNIVAVLFGGRDTTSSAILYSFYNLAQYPDEQNKILEELKTVDSIALTFEDVKKLKYLDAFVWETLRLYPAVPSNTKQAAEDDVLPDGTFIPAGTDVFYSAWYMGRNNAKLWGEDQLEFRPERWLEMKTRPTPYEFPVFQGGPRICPGMNMALLETKLFVAILLQKFHVKIQNGEQLKDRAYAVGLTLVMKDGLPLQLTPRLAPAK